MGESDLPLGFVIVVIVGALVWLRVWLWPKKTRRERQKEERERIEMLAEGTLTEVPPLQPGEPYIDMFDKMIGHASSGSARAQPMGPSAPTGLPPITPPVPFGGRVGPAYLTGAMKQQSGEALALIREHFPPEQRQKTAERLPNPDWDVLYGMAADLLGAVRWYPNVVSKAMNDQGLAALFSNDPINCISSCIDSYRQLVPPGPDKDQALGILGFYLRNMQVGSEYVDTAGEAWVIAAIAFDQKAHLERVAAGTATPMPKKHRSSSRH